MLEDRETLYSLGLVLFLLVATMSYNNMRSKEENQQKDATGGSEDVDATGWLSKFAVQGGNVVGETVSVSGDDLILKQAGFYKLVPLAMAKVHGDEVVIGEDVDWDAAGKAGMAWKEANTQGQHDEITSDLTRSEDVKAPALGAMEPKVDAPAHPPGLSDDSEE